MKRPIYTRRYSRARYRTARYRAGIRCVYTETGGKTVGDMQMSDRLFTGNTISVDVIRNFARRRQRQRQRKQRRVWVLEALHWETERCRRIMHTCARRIVPLGPRIFRICQNFTSAVCAYYHIDTECYNIEANHDKVQTEPIHSPDLYLSSLRSHWPT